MRLGVDFYDRELPGRVAARVVYDLDQIAVFLETGVYDIVTAITLLVASFTVIGVWQPTVALAVAGAVPILAILTVVQLRPADRAYQRARAALGDVVARLQEDFAGRHVIEAAGAEEQSRSEFAHLAFALRQARRRSTTIANGYVVSMQFVGSIAGAILLGTAADRVFEGDLSVGGLVALQLFLTAALAPIPQLSDTLQRYLAARASFRTLGEPFKAEIRPVERAETTACRSAGGDIVLKDLSFAYPGTSRTVLSDIDLTIPKGTCVAIVGPTGAGKSSIAKLVARVYDPDDGAVRIGRKDIRDWDIASYRNRIGIVPQDGFCFRGTVAENIAYGRPGATRAEIEDAAAAVGALDAVLGLVGGLDARVEEEGRNLTAAQVQLIALARAWLTRPDILILDEATSSLDPVSEQLVLKATRAMKRTTIMITHRLPVAESADLVVVVADGRIAEQGKPQQLKRRKGAYAALWKAGPEVDARVAGSDEARLAAMDRALDVAVRTVVVTVPYEDPIITATLLDLTSGSLGASSHSLDTADGASTRPRAEAALTATMIGETDEEILAFLDGAGGVEAVGDTLLETMRLGIDPAVAGDLSIGFVVNDGVTDHRWVLTSTESASAATLSRSGDASLTIRVGASDLLRMTLGQLDPGRLDHVGSAASWKATSNR